MARSVARLYRLDASRITRQLLHPVYQHPNMKTLPIICAAVMSLVSFSHAAGEGWTSDFEAAKKQAAESSKDLLIDFTGSDWCGFCIKLDEEVFKHDAFKNAVKDKFVLVELDFPQDKTKLSEAVQAQNQKLSEAYGIEGFPSILLTDAKGLPFAKTGYQEGGPEKYVEHLNELHLKRKARDEAFAAAAKLEGVEKAKTLYAALQAMNLSETIIANFYQDVIDQIKKADPEDSTGLGKKAAAAQRMKAFQSELQELAAKKDMDGAMALVDKTLKEGGFEPEEKMQVMMVRALVFAEQGKFDDALKAVDEAKAVAPDSPMAAGIEQFRKQLEQAAKGDAEKPAEDE